MEGPGLTSCNSISEDLLEEIESLKAIYENQVSSIIVGKEVIVILSDPNVLVEFHINNSSDYPEIVPEIKIMRYVGGAPEKLLVSLERCANENRGIPMLYKLISNTLDAAGNEGASVIVEPSKSICKFYMTGKCRFGSKCMNLHPAASEKQNRKIENSECRVDNRNNTTKLKSKQHANDATSSKKTSTKDETFGSEKKKPMKTATDVIHRIMWDDSFPTENFVVGYLDRFLGVQEKPFTAFSWEDLASVDYNVLAIPKHRIQYFKYKDVVIWDKNERLDLVFGSTGNEVLITDIINDDSVIEIDENVKNEMEKDNDDDGDDYTYYSSRFRPNYFMVLKISNDEIKDNIIKVQDHITYHDDRLKSVAISPEVFHITLIMMRLNNEGEFIKASAVLKSLERILICMLPLGRFCLTVKGITDFRRQVVIAEVLQSKTFTKFVDIAKIKLKDAGIKLVGNHEPYSPHLSLLKLNRPFSREQRIDCVNSMYYADLHDLYIGKQEVDTLRICSTGEERGYDKFYVSLSTISNNLLCVSSKLPSLIATLLQNLMGAGLILEDDGDNMLEEILSNEASRFEQNILTLENLLPSFKEFYISNKKHVIIMRGLPGSGKSYFVEKLQESSQDISFSVCSADQYFQNDDSGYKFSDNQISSAHMFCQDKFVESIADGVDIVVIDNTHLAKWEYQIYQRIALLCGYNCNVISIDCHNETMQSEFYKRCQHTIKPHVHKEMYERYENDEDSIYIDSSTTISLSKLLNDGHLLPLCSSNILYTALYLDIESQQLLLSMYPPVHENVTADHVTLIYEPTQNDLLNVSIGKKVSVEVIGYVVNNCIQAIIVRNFDGLWSSDDKKHVTISTNKTTPPKDVHYWVANQPCLPSISKISLTGTIGVQVVTSIKKSRKCIDFNMFQLISKELYSKDSMVSVSVDDDNTEKDEDDSFFVESGMYFGPDVIKSLFIFDFDGTLFNTPDPSVGRIDYENATGKRWPLKGWLCHPESILYPLHVFPGPSLADYFGHYDRACSKTVLLTGRIEPVRSGLVSVLAAYGMTFDAVILKPVTSSSKATSSVHGFKKEVVKNLMKELPHLETVKFWDDRKDNIDQIKGLQKTIRDVHFDIFHVDRSLPKFYSMTISSILERVGIRPTEEFNFAVKEGIDYIIQICNNAFDADNYERLVFKFGSNLLGRKGDVDLCILAPADISADECVRKFGEKAKLYGIQHVHVASFTRFPLVKLKIRYQHLSAVDFDIIFVPVLENTTCNNYHEDFDFEMMLKHCVNKKARDALEGLLFFDRFVAPLLDRIDVNDFGIIIDVVGIILKRNHLKGNVFLCIRTFHLVMMLSEFLYKCSNDLIAVEGWKNLKEFEKLLQLFLRFCSEKTFDEYRNLLTDTVPEIYIERLRRCFLQSSEQKVLNLLFQGPKLITKQNNVTIKLLGDDKALMWSKMCVVEARLRKCLWKLVEIGITLTPGLVLDNEISFNVTPLDTCRSILDELESELSGELPSNVSLKIDLL